MIVQCKECEAYDPDATCPQCLYVPEKTSMTLLESDMNQIVFFEYEGKKRHVVPRMIHFGTTPEHKIEQWLLSGYDLDKQATRTFALSGISGVRKT